MSRHIFHSEQAGKAVEVVLGFDGPLGHFFLVVQEADKVIYSNLFEEDAFGKGLEFFKARLHELEVHVPDSMFTEVALDKHLGRHGAVVVHT